MCSHVHVERRILLSPVVYENIYHKYNFSSCSNYVPVTLRGPREEGLISIGGGADWEAGPRLISIGGGADWEAGPRLTSIGGGGGTDWVGLVSIRCGRGRERTGRVGLVVGLMLPLAFSTARGYQYWYRATWGHGVGDETCWTRTCGWRESLVV